MRIGIGKKSDEGLRFDIDIPGLAPFPLDLVRNPNAGGNQPDWLANYRGGRCGAFWKKTSASTGEDFLTGQIESPGLPGGRIDVAIFNSKEDKGCKDMTWRYLQPKDRGDSASHSEPVSGQGARASAPTSGGEDDDDIPF